tara:strand:- start:43 stop:189 length:147 start_codon:yes stop_codon:yes gene_type:complete
MIDPGGQGAIPRAISRINRCSPECSVALQDTNIKWNMLWRRMFCGRDM